MRKTTDADGQWRVGGLVEAGRIVCVCPGCLEAAARLNPGLSKPLCESRPLDLERSGTPGYKWFVESLRCSDGQGYPPPSLWLLMVTPSRFLAYSQRLWRHPEPSYSAHCVLSVMHDRAFPAAAPSPAGFRNPCHVVFSTADTERKDIKLRCSDGVTKL